MSLSILFTNNSGHADKHVSIGFVSGSTSAPFDVSITGGSAIQPLNVNPTGDTYPFAGNWYTLDTLSSGLTINSFSGRIYVAYGSAWQVQSANYEPAQAVTDSNFFLRYDKMELTVSGSPSDVADLTSIDYWSIPMSLATSLSGVAQQSVSGLMGGATAATVQAALTKLTTPPQSGLPGLSGNDGHALPALVPGSFVQFDSTSPAPGTTFARIIGPSSYPSINPVAIPVLPYQTYQDYLQYLATTFGPGTPLGTVVPDLGDGIIAVIAGNFAGVGPVVPTSGPQSAQKYLAVATIDTTLDVTVSGVLVGNNNQIELFSLLFKAADMLNPSGIYGGNTPYYLPGATTSTMPGNDVYGWISGDVWSGFNIGAIGSTTPVSSGSSILVGGLPSSQWFRLPVSGFFDGLQPDNPYYNQWAKTLSEYSQAYNFAYSDRFSPVLVNIGPQYADTLTITLEVDDTTNPS